MSAPILAELIRGLWTSFENLLVIVLRTVAVYVALFVGIRMMGKREVGQMTPFDLILVLLLANSVQNAMVGPDSSLVGGLCAAGVLLALNRGIDHLTLKNERFARLLRGRARPLIKDGVILHEGCSSEGITREDIDQALREHDVALADVSEATLEVDGTISVQRKDGARAGTKPPRRSRFKKH